MEIIWCAKFAPGQTDTHTFWDSSSTWSWEKFSGWKFCSLNFSFPDLGGCFSGVDNSAIPPQIYAWFRNSDSSFWRSNPVFFCFFFRRPYFTDFSKVLRLKIIQGCGVPLEPPTTLGVQSFRPFRKTKIENFPGVLPNTHNTAGSFSRWRSRLYCFAHISNSGAHLWFPHCKYTDRFCVKKKKSRTALIVRCKGCIWKFLRRVHGRKDTHAHTHSFAAI